MAKPKVVPIKPKAVLETDARANFANYVQSVAFNMTLSRQMVEALGLIRDFGRISDAHGDHRPDDTFDDWASRNPMGGRSRLDRHSVTYWRALKHRGLVIDVPRDLNNPKWWQQRSIALTRAGELMCELLVEAGLLAPALPAKKRANAK